MYFQHSYSLLFFICGGSPVTRCVCVCVCCNICSLTGAHQQWEVKQLLLPLTGLKHVNCVKCTFLKNRKKNSNKLLSIRFEWL